MNIRPILFLALLTAIAFAGCTSKSGGSNESKVTISNFKFSPDSLTVSSGETITFQNSDTPTHTATSDMAGVFDTGNIAPGSSATAKITTPGTYTYHCSIHPSMTGTIVVK